MNYKIPLVLSPQPEGGFTVTSPVVPELVSEGNTVDEALANAKDALAAVIEAYEDVGRALPVNVQIHDATSPHLAGNSGRNSMKYREVAVKLTTLGCEELPRRGGGSHRKWLNPVGNASACCQTGAVVI